MQEHSRAMTSCAADLWDPVRFELQHTSIGSVATRGQPALDPMVFEAGLLGGPATATTLHPSSQTLIEEDPVSEKDSDKDGDAAEKPASDPMVLEAGLQPSTEHAPTQEDTTGATDNIDTESAPATLHATPSTATPAASQEGDGGLPSEDGAECTPNVVGTACPTPDAVPATPVPTAGISSARMAPAPDSSGAQSPAPAIPDAPVAASPTDATPTSSVAARRLEKFAEAVQVKRPSPIIAEPPRQKPVLHSCAANGPQSGLQTW